jgi:quercetin dioxygenase-like cupin family protein
LVAAAAPALPTGAAAQMPMPGANEGQELASGVRAVQYGKGTALLPAYKSLLLGDVIFQPGSDLPPSTMENDIVCHIAAGELRVMQNDKELRLMQGDVGSSATGTKEGARNEGSTIAVMRISIC